MLKKMCDGQSIEENRVQRDGFQTFVKPTSSKCRKTGHSKTNNWCVKTCDKALQHAFSGVGNDAIADGICCWNNCENEIFNGSQYDCSCDEPSESARLLDDATDSDHWFPARLLDGMMAGLMSTWRPHPQQLAATATKATRELDGMMATKPDEWFPARELDGMMATKDGLMSTWRPHQQQLAATATQATRELEEADKGFSSPIRPRQLDGMMATKPD